MNAFTTAIDPYPFNAKDIWVVEDGSMHPFIEADWSNDRHKLLVFIPETFTPVCQTELGAINDWIKPFDELNCDIIAAGTDSANSFSDWYNEEPLLANPKFKTFASYLLPGQLGLLDGGRVKRASVFVTAEGEVVKQEHFKKVGRSFAELHRMLYGYVQDSYCAEGWKSPVDGFLTPVRGK